jgi:hypothetical protein
MTTTYDYEPDPIDGGVQQAYIEIREALELILALGVGPELYAEAVDNPQALAQQVLISLDDAVSNNWDELMVAFWRGVAQDVALMEEISTQA